MAQQKKNENKTYTDHRQLRCDLDQAEILAAGQDLATALDDRDSLQADKESVMRDFKAREAALDALITRTQLMVRNKWVMRSVACKCVLNYAKDKFTVIRLDTGEVLTERPLTEDEKQMSMEFDEAA